MNNYAPIVSNLTEGEVKVNCAHGSKDVIRDLPAELRKEGDKVLFYHIKGGVLEMKDNKAIILAD
ncbi:hypothetical protein [Salegentibacter tibetensis]|uniref:hypothetical protein n=1 Tax=Salegentibacter tibetensis TaxID=2873600 RepID=UPI001F326F76